MSGHTPGPWEAVEWTDSTPLAGVAFAVQRQGTHDARHRICEMVGQAGEDGQSYSSERTTATARLIAAAPELLTAILALRVRDDTQLGDWWVVEKHRVWGK